MLALLAGLCSPGWPMTGDGTVGGLTIHPLTAGYSRLRALMRPRWPMRVFPLLGGVVPQSQVLLVGMFCCWGCRGRVGWLILRRVRFPIYRSIGRGGSRR
ncbi:MAG: hypothetical protein IPL78_27145 [Chloroflexi bacterium]|nr:hypothetical protein [Chloroflexota bacterium]